MPQGEASPLSHSMDSDALHFPGGLQLNLYENLGLTKFAVLNLTAAGLVVAAFYLLRRNVDRHGYARGRLMNALEAMLVYVREKIAFGAIGKKDADRFVPLLWTIFFFVLFGNLLGMLPWLGSPTGALGTTFALALCVFITTHAFGIADNGPAAYAKSFVPPVPPILKPVIGGIELISHLIRPLTLGFRLFVNMLAGHTVLYVILTFIGAALGAQAMHWTMSWAITGASVAGLVFLSALELLVAFVQAFLFTLLTALYIGGALHPHH